MERKIKKSKNLHLLMNHFFHLYGRRNSIYLSGLKKRVVLLSVAFKDMQDAVRKDVVKSKKALALARIVSRIFCIAENFKQLPLVEMMARKYPATCSYCQKIPCKCPERRKDYVLSDKIAEEQIDWSLKDWSIHLERLYGKRNRKKGVENILNRLIAEIIEFEVLVVELPRSVEPLHIIEQEFALELADTLAWTIALAYMLEIDLEKEVLRRYGGPCKTCGKIPCIGTHLNFKQIDWSKSISSLQTSRSHS